MPDLDSQLAACSHERLLPQSVGKQVLITVAGFTAVLLVVMEIKARQDDLRINYYPLREDLWVSQWLELDALPDDQLVIIGASRMLFGVIVQEWKNLTGVKPQMLAFPGSPPGPVLTKLAEHQSFRGTVLCGFAPPFSFCHEDSPTFNRMTNNFKAIEPSRYSLSHHLSLATHDLLKPMFKCFNSSAYSPVLLSYSNFPITNREGTLLTPLFPFAGSLDRELQFRFTDNIEVVIKQGIVDQIQNSSRRVIRFYGPADVEEMIKQYKNNVATIESRGEKAIFVRPPSDGLYLAFEEEHFPRERFFDRIVRETGCMGVHFQDYPELKDFLCVEDSHLRVEDSLEYTRRLIKILRRENAIE